MGLPRPDRHNAEEQLAQAVDDLVTSRRRQLQKQCEEEADLDSGDPYALLMENGFGGAPPQFDMSHSDNAVASLRRGDEDNASETRTVFDARDRHKRRCAWKSLVGGFVIVLAAVLLAPMLQRRLARPDVSVASTTASSEAVPSTTVSQMETSTAAEGSVEEGVPVANDSSSDPISEGAAQPEAELADNNSQDLGDESIEEERESNSSNSVERVAIEATEVPSEVELAVTGDNVSSVIEESVGQSSLGPNKTGGGIVLEETS